MHIRHDNSYPPHTSELRKMVFASLFAALTAVGAYIQIPIPFSPVPVTLQVFFVLLAGSMLKSKWGSLSMVVYTLRCCRASGLFRRQFRSGSAPGTYRRIYFSVLSWLRTYRQTAEKAERAGKSGLAVNALNMSGNLTIYALGVTQLMLVAEIGLGTALALGAIPFIPGVIVKTAAAAYIATTYKL